MIKLSWSTEQLGLPGYVRRRHNDLQLIVEQFCDVLESEEYRDSFDYHLLAPLVV